MNIETIAAVVTAPGAVGTAMTAVPGDTLTTRAARPGTAAAIISVSIDQQVTPGWIQVVYPSGHDTTRGIRLRGQISEPGNRLTPGTRVPVQPQELLSLTVVGSATAGDVEVAAITMWYEDVPGLSGRLLTADQMWDMVEKIVTIEDTITPTVAATWSGGRAINAGSDLLLPNRDYAVLGGNFAVECGVLAVRGPDTANVRCGIPGNDVQVLDTTEHFARLARLTGLPCIPIINSGNKGGTIVEIVQDENLAAVPFSLNLALLRNS